uniref:Uncharacterized protein n=1 Tax=Eutreptiella gymnastica TaxID=73025 RepID=A0A7S4FYY5_9EUGL
MSKILRRCTLSGIVPIKNTMHSEKGPWLSPGAEWAHLRKYPTPALWRVSSCKTGFFSTKSVFSGHVPDSAPMAVGRSPTAEVIGHWWPLVAGDAEPTKIRPQPQLGERWPLEAANFQNRPAPHQSGRWVLKYCRAPSTTSCTAAATSGLRTSPRVQNP